MRTKKKATTAAVEEKFYFGFNPTKNDRMATVLNFHHNILQTTYFHRHSLGSLLALPWVCTLSNASVSVCVRVLLCFVLDELITTE